MLGVKHNPQIFLKVVKLTLNRLSGLARLHHAETVIQFVLFGTNLFDKRHNRHL